MKFRLFSCCLVCIFFVGNLPTSFAQQTDYLREFQYRAVKLNQGEWLHWGNVPDRYSSHTNHSNRLVPVYTWGASLDSIQGENSVYRDAAKLESIYGFVPKQTVNPNADYFDQTELYSIQRDAWKSGKKNIILVVFDGMDWQTTQAASVYKNQNVLYRSGRGTGLKFLDYRPEGAVSDYGYCVTAAHNTTTKYDVNAQVVTVPGETKLGGYSAMLGGLVPWSRNYDASYLIGASMDIVHPFTDSAATATSLCTGAKTYKSAINVDPVGKHVTPLGLEMQKEGALVGVVTSVPISHATPAAAYANNVNRSDYQDISRDLLGLKSSSHPDNPLPGVDVLIGCGWGSDRADDRFAQGTNYVPGNRYLAKGDLEKIDSKRGGKYVVATRTAGQKGEKILSSAADEAAKTGKRLFGFFGHPSGHLPYQTADGKFDPVPGVTSGETYSAADIHENPTLTEMTQAALSVLEKNEEGFFLMVEAGDVDWANHNNNIDNSIGAVLSGEAAFEAIVDWVEQNSSWDETCLVLTADHGHMLVIDDIDGLAGNRQLVDKSVFEAKLAAKIKADKAKKAAQEAAAWERRKQLAESSGGFFDDFDSKTQTSRAALRGDWQFEGNEGRCVSDPELYKKYKNHGPILRYPCEFSNGVIEFEIKPKDVQRFVFTLNEQGHVFRCCLADEKRTRIFGWSGLSKETKAETIAKDKVPQISELDGKWTSVRIRIEGKKATVSIGNYRKTMTHACLSRAKKELTLSFASGEMAFRRLRVRPDDAEPTEEIGTSNDGDEMQVSTYVPQEQDALQTLKNAQSIFDGKTIDGWHNPYEWGRVSVVDGEIHLVADKKFFLMSDAKYGDYIFEGEVRLPEGKANSGFMLRGQEKKNKVFGYQAEADPTDRRWSGGLYDEGRRQWLNPLKDQPEAQKAFKKTDWNRYRIACEGDHLQVWVNGIQTTDYYDPVDLLGGIGLQHHGEKGQLYRFRNLKVVDNGRHVWKPIFNESLRDNWTSTGGGNWEFTDGVLVGTSKKAEKRHGLFYSKESYSDFTARITFRLTEGNSGFYFRSEINDSAVGVKGIQAELENSALIGGLYETAGRAWLVKPLHYYDSYSEDRQKGRTKQWKNAHKGGEWSTMVVSAHGDRIVTHVGDILACDLVDPQGRKDGRFAIQLHGGQDMKIEVKSIELLEKE